MSKNNNLQQIQALLKEHSQSHLLTFWQHIDRSQQKKLTEQILALDFDRIDGWVKDIIGNSAAPAMATGFEPAPAYPPAPADSSQRQLYEKARSLGEQLIAQGKVAPFVVAGGQGTRLGFDGPKGDFPISPVRNKTLFRLFAEYIAAAGRRYGRDLPWYIMTSPLNHAQTLHILRENDYYGLDAENIFVFQQGTLPNFDSDGRILLADKASIACSPDGHGGSLKALYQSGALADMKKRGVEIISYFQVDNPLINILDPLFIGLHRLDESEMSSKALKKAGPKEKTGNFCLVDGKVIVIEYSDLPDELAEATNSDGSLVFELGSIAIHLINTSFVERLNSKGFALPLHRALKKIPHIDEQGNAVKPTEPNGVKLETFVFDALPLASKSIILEILREEEFAPTKNATGLDSLITAQQMMIDRCAGWLESAGIEVPRKADGSVDACIEISPGFALYKEDVKAKAGTIDEIKPGQKVCLNV